MRYLLSFLLFVCACSGDECEHRYNYDWGFDYKISDTVETDLGIVVDYGKNDVSLKEIDDLTIEVQDCLSQTIPDGIIENYENSYCKSGNVDISIDFSCLTVKVPNRWDWSCDGKEQVLLEGAPQEGCRQKGFEYDPNCPCRWRGGIQDSKIIIITPNLRMYKTMLIMFITGCDDIWENEKLSSCTN